MTIPGSSRGSGTSPSEQEAEAPPKVAAEVPIVLLHGFTQTGRSWRPVVEAFTRIRPGRVVHRPDLPGHGDADPADDDSPLDVTAARLADRFGRALWVGYSMGGRLALRLAVDHPEVVGGLIVVGATAGIDDAGERAARRESDRRLATRIEDEGVPAFLEHWRTLPLFGGFRAAPDDLAARRANRAVGLASSLRAAGTGTMDPPLWPELARITAPTVVSAGSRDRKFVELGRRLVGAIGANARLEILPDGAHTAHLEDPGRFAEIMAGHPVLG